MPPSSVTRMRQETATRKTLSGVEVKRSLGGCSQATERNSWETGCWELVGSACGKAEGLSMQYVTEDTCETLVARAEASLGTWHHVESRTWVVVQIGRSGGRLWNVENTALDCSSLDCPTVLLLYCLLYSVSVSLDFSEYKCQQSYCDGGQTCRHFLGSGTTKERYVLLLFFFNCLCSQPVSRLFRSLSAAWWWRARKISSIRNNLNEVGPTFFFAINIFVLTLCFTCFFRSRFVRMEAGSF